MFAAAEKAKQVGILVLERIGDYLELIDISVEIQRHEFGKRLVGLIAMALFAVLSLIFLGLAVIVTCWDTPYRVISAWGVVGFYLVAACIAGFAGWHRMHRASTLETLRGELQQDIKLMKDLV